MAPPASESKSCSKCGEVKPLAQFGAKRGNRDGLNSRCKPCAQEDKRESWHRNREANLVKARASYLANREERIAKQAAWKKANPDRIRRYSQTWRERNPGRDTADTRAWIAANPERAAENFRRNTLKRRARKLAASIGPVDLAALWLTQGVNCPLCDKAIDRDVKYPDPLSASVDHILPLSKGGAHEQSNLQWTHLVCNQKKGTSVPATTAADSPPRI